VVFSNGVNGVVVSEPVTGDRAMKHMFIDIGAKDKEEAESMVRLGDMAVYAPDCFRLGEYRVASPAMDDRCACALLVKLMQTIGDTQDTVIAVFSVQEEVGCRGAVTAAHQIKPDIGVSVDVTPDHAYPCDLEGSSAVGEGISVTLGDPSAMLDEYLVDEMLSCCEEHGIHYQRGVMDRGGTDASSMNLSGDGVRVAGIAVVDRYPHSKCSVIAKDDVEAGVELLDQYTRRTFVF